MIENVLLAVGNAMMGDDGAGPLLAEKLTMTPVPGWAVIDGGSIPENFADQVIALNPRRVVIVDAAEMSLEAGEIRVVDPQCIAELFFMTTHNLPISFLMERLGEQVPEVVFVGIQPAVVAYGFPMMEPVQKAVELLYQRILSGQGLDQMACLMSV
jgi:hydrogenase 3 maturation protease